MSNRGLIIIGGASLAALALYLYSRKDAGQESYFVDAGDILGSTVGQVVDTLDDLTGGFMKVSNIKKAKASDLLNANVKAFLKVIRRGEGTSDAGGYNRLFGGGSFSSFVDHPRQLVKKSGYTSTAAGAYQFIISTWDETARELGLKDFTPASQDLAAVGRIAARGALEDVKAGRFEAAIRKCAREWASLPYSPYGQPVISIATAQSVYSANGGSYA